MARSSYGLDEAVVDEESKKETNTYTKLGLEHSGARAWRVGANRSQHGTAIRYFSGNPAVRDPTSGAFEIGEVAPGISKEDFVKHRQLVTEQHECTVVDARSLPLGLATFDFDTHGFTYLPQAPGVNQAVRDFRSREDREKELVPRVAEHVQRFLGCSEIFCIGHSCRHDETGRGTSAQSYARFAHCDYGPGFDRPFRTMLVHRHNMSEQRAERCGLCVVTYWAPMENPAYKDPFCLLDAATHDFELGTVPYFYRGQLFPEQKREPLKQVPVTAQTAPAVGPLHSPDHRWVFLSDMMPEEAVVFKQFDFRGDGRARVAFHNSFRDTFHDNWAECPGRKSVEVRLLLVFDEAEPVAARL